MLPFEYERLERLEEGICIYHNVIMIKSIGKLRKQDFLTRAEYNVDQSMISFYEFDKLVQSFYFVPEYIETA